MSPKPQPFCMKRVEHRHRQPELRSLPPRGDDRSVLAGEVAALRRLHGLTLHRRGGFAAGLQRVVGGADRACARIGTCRKTRHRRRGGAVLIITRRLGSRSACRAGQGRPLGLLMHFLRMPNPLSKELHMEAVPDVTSQQRQEARTFLESLPGSAAILGKERPRRPGEGPEPEQRP